MMFGSFRPNGLLHAVCRERDASSERSDASAVGETEEVLGVHDGVEHARHREIQQIL